MEDNETPEECIIREMKEEMNLDLEGFQLFGVREFGDRTEYTFWRKASLDIEKIQLQEGQRLKWFTESEAEEVELAFGFNELVRDFFDEAPFDKPT